MNETADELRPDESWLEYLARTGRDRRASFTREDVAFLRVLSTYMRERGSVLVNVCPMETYDASACESLADRIAALLPPPADVSL